MSQPNSASREPAPAGPGPGLPADPFVRFDARFLDPATAVRPADGVAPSPTAYRGDRLLITAPNAVRARQIIAAVEAAAGPDLTVAGPDPLVVQERAEGFQEHNRLARLLALAEASGTPLVFPIRLVPVSDRPSPAVDVWPVLQNLRATGAAGLAAAVGLDHLMYSAAVIVGNPFVAHATAITGNPFVAHATSVIAGNPFVAHATSSAADSYSYAGSGGRSPVCVVMPEPTGSGADRSAVLVLDTGVGVHPWFVSRPVERVLTLSTGDHVGLDVSRADVAASDPEGAGAIADPMTGMLASHAGHGTFIAGLLRQTCPDADITVLRIMDADGVVPESTLTTALMGVAVKLVDSDPAHFDALVLSLGYYPETPEDQVYSAGLKDLLLTIAARGVVTFTAAGNDSSLRRSYPAGFADDPAFGPLLPLVAVAALNPDRTVALFSNDGGWVRGAAAGANIVSTSPKLERGSDQPAVSLTDPFGRRRATIDPDDFSGGFATWSGTSFAAPVLAGQFLQALVDGKSPKAVSERRSLVPVRGTG